MMLSVEEREISPCGSKMSPSSIRCGECGPSRLLWVPPAHVSLTPSSALSPAFDFVLNPFHESILILNHESPT